MGLEYQRTIKEFADKYGAENLVAMLGFLNLSLFLIYVITLNFGDISYAGPLSGVALRLSIHHILEPEIKAQIPQDVYTEQIGLMEVVIDPKKIKEISQILTEIKTLDSAKLEEYLEQKFEYLKKEFES